MTNQDFCKFFKNGLVINNNNSHMTVAPCCYYKTTNKINYLEKDFNLNSIKHHWLNSDVNTECEICNTHESSHLPSYRQASFDIIENETDQIVMLTVAVNKKCNLACVTCDAESSSFWFQENIRNGVVQSKEIIQIHQEDKEKITNEKFFNFLKTIDLSQLKYIKFGGGEPLMSDTHFQILQLVPNPQNVQIQYTSNFSIMPNDKIFSLWKKFNLIKWCASIDGTDDQFEILRWPYKWEKFLTFKDLALKLSPVNVMFGIEHTLNALNIFYYDRMEKWYSREFCQNRLGDTIDFNLHVAHGTVGLDKTPLELREQVYKKYGKTHKISLLLQQTALSQNKQMIDFLDNLDKSRNVNWRKTFSEVEKFYV